MVLYTGVETRAMMNEKEPRMKFGRLEDELNKISKFLFGFMVVISLTIVALNAFSGKWYIQFFRFILLLSSIIPISLRVNLDIAKIYYCS
jgi:phospholipid-translocating ATPase